MRAHRIGLIGPLLLVVAAAAGFAAGPPRAVAQQNPTSSWPASNEQGALPDAGKGTGAGSGNTTVLTRTPLDAKGPPQTAVTPAGPQSSGASQVTLVGLLTQDGQRIDQGLVWRVFQDGKDDPEGKKRVVSNSRDAGPALRLAPGDY